jgi:hypothetical protein
MVGGGLQLFLKVAREVLFMHRLLFCTAFFFVVMWKEKSGKNEYGIGNCPKPPGLQFHEVVHLEHSDPFGSIKKSRIYTADLHYNQCENKKKQEVSIYRNDLL